MNNPVVDRLRDILPADAVITEPEVLAAQASDRSGLAGAATALAVVRPASTADVSAVLRIANETRTPVVPQGARTGLAGAANASTGALLLDMGRMNRIVAIDDTERSATVQPAVVVQDLQNAVAAHGLFYAPDPASAEWATIGGTIATNAGGMRAVKYGVTRDSVQSLEVVLADGTVLRTRPDTVKGVAAFDLTGLIVGSEGTLAVVTEATLRLLPAPGESIGVAATFPDVTGALAAANAIMTQETLPATIELLDGVAMRAIREYAPALGLPETAGAWLIAVSDAPVGADVEVGRFADAMRANSALTVERADDAESLGGLLAARRLLNQAVLAMLGSSLNGDVSVPRKRLAEFVARFATLADELGVEVSVGGHVGDGNLHPIVAYRGDDPDQVAAAREAYRGMLRLAQEVGGTMTGEHGVGLEKLSEVRGEVSDRAVELLSGIKRVFDPNGILNPGKKLAG